MNDTFVDKPRELNVRFAPMPEAPFVLRFDYQATKEGMRGGLPFQETEWEPIQANSWNEAKNKARARVQAIPLCRFDKHAPQHLQGVVLVEVVKVNQPFRTVSFRKSS